MAVIDAHAHIYPDKIASRAVDAVGDFYLIDMFGVNSFSESIFSPTFKLFSYLLYLF